MRWCPEPDSNRHAPEEAARFKLAVSAFHHPGVGARLRLGTRPYPGASLEQRNIRSMLSYFIDRLMVRQTPGTASAHARAGLRARTPANGNDGNSPYPHGLRATAPRHRSPGVRHPRPRRRGRRVAGPDATLFARVLRHRVHDMEHSAPPAQRSDGHGVRPCPATLPAGQEGPERAAASGRHARRVPDTPGVTLCDERAPRAAEPSRGRAQGPSPTSGVRRGPAGATQVGPGNGHGD